MKQPVQESVQGQHASSHKVVSMTSPYMFFELLSFKKYCQASFLIPQTILLQKGSIKQWLFNSAKRNNKILKKKRQNSVPLNVVKAFCLRTGYNLNHLNTLSQLKLEYQQIRKQQAKKQPQNYKIMEDKKIVQILTTEDDILGLTLNEFINLVSQNRYNEHMFFERWKVIRQKINIESRIDECYEVISIRRNHILQSKCHKIIALKTGELTPMSSVELENDPFKEVSPTREEKVAETKNLQGYKFFDTFLNKKFFSMAQQLVQYIEKNYKCIVEQIKTKYVINKSREPFLMGISYLKIKPLKKICQEDEFEQFSAKGQIKVEQYLKCLKSYLIRNEQDTRIDHFALIDNLINKSKCNGDFCKIKLNKIPHLSSDPNHGFSERSKHFNLDPAIHSLHKRTVFSDILTSVRKRKLKVLQKLKNFEIIDYDPEEEIEQSSDYEQDEEQDHKNQKVCENCHSIYLHIQKIFQIDFRSGNLIEKKESLFSNHTFRIRSHSEKRLPPISNRSQIFKNSVIIKDGGRVVNTEEKSSQKQISSRQEPRALSFRNKNLNKFQQQFLQNEHGQKTKFNRFEQLQNTKLNPIQSFTSMNKGTAKANRLLALSKGTQGITIQSANKPAKLDSKLATKILKAKNFQQVEQNLIEKLSMLPSCSESQLVYFASKYYQDNLPQQLDRKCHSSQYLTGLYQFMMNSDLQLHPKNRIRKRPQISLKRLSELTDFPEIVSKSAFHFDTIITDEKTTIPFCIITTKMINGKSAVNIPFENIFIVHDIFDCFIQYIPLVKDVLQNTVNKRVVLFNLPGQSHTIYNQKNPINFPQFCFILDKLLYRVNTQKDQLGFINFKKDKIKFIGVGYGGYLLTSYLGNNFQFYKTNLTGVLLINTYKNITQTLKQKAIALNLLYSSSDEVVASEAFLYYSKAIQSSEIDKEDLQYKAGLNPIRMEGRVHLLQSLLDMSIFETNSHNTLVQNFQLVNSCPVHIIYGRSNVLFTKSHAQRYLLLEDTQVKKQQIPKRKFIEIEGGHDLLADNYDDLEKNVSAFVLL